MPVNELQLRNGTKDNAIEAQLNDQGGREEILATMSEEKEKILSHSKFCVVFVDCAACSLIRKMPVVSGQGQLYNTSLMWIT